MIQYHIKVTLLIPFPLPGGAVEAILSSVTHGATVDVDVAPSLRDSKTSVVNITVCAATNQEALCHHQSSEPIQQYLGLFLTSR